MKKIVITFITVIFIVALQSSFTYAASSDSWVKDAFSATSRFLNENATDTIGISKPFKLFKDLIKAINKVLLVALAGMSIIALSITGIKYILSSSSPDRQGEAKKSLKTIFIGMIIGFGAFTIWNIAISIINIIIDTFAEA